MSDGILGIINTSMKLVPGDVVRFVTENDDGIFASTFSDCIILNIKDTPNGKTYDLVRPHACVRKIGSVPGTPYIAFEPLNDVPQANLEKSCRVVLSSRGNVMNHLL